MAEVTVIGGGLAGCEAAWQLAEAGFSVRLLEMKPVQYTPAHHYEGLAELVCSNSLKADRLNSAAGLLKAEKTRLGSLLMRCARKSAVAAGGALAVDRKQFSDFATEAIRNHPNITLETAVATEIPDTPTVVATGPLTEGALAADIEKRCGTRLSFFDAAAPIVSFESLDKEKVFFAARYGRGDADYINCPMNKAEYEEFYQALIGAERAPLHDCDKDAFRVYEGCMPIEVLASRGMDTMRFGPLKPVGLTDPRTGHRPWAVVQLRRENSQGPMYNLVGFQTHLRFPEQKRVFSMIPGLEKAEFLRYGVMHRNSYLCSPRVLDGFYRAKKDPRVMFAGQMTGVEGYVESTASGFACGLNMARSMLGLPLLEFSTQTAIGALSRHISCYEGKNFQPMNINFGLIDGLDRRVKGKRERYMEISHRSLEQIEAYRNTVMEGTTE